MTTLFWVGEASGEENAFIPNDQSYWDRDWQDHYGGIDNPGTEADTGLPIQTKGESLLLALPYGEFTRRVSSSAEPGTYPGLPTASLRF